MAGYYVYSLRFMAEHMDICNLPMWLWILIYQVGEGVDRPVDGRSTSSGILGSFGQEHRPPRAYRLVCLTADLPCSKYG